MKNVIYLVTGMTIVILTLVVLFTIEGKSARENEVNTALKLATYQSIDLLTDKRNYMIEDQQELLADVTQQILMQIKTGDAQQSDSCQKIQIDVASVNAEKGILSLHVTETYTKPNKTLATAETETTVVLDQKVKTEKVILRYKLPDRLYKEYYINKNQVWKEPKSPVVEGKTFIGWLDVDTNTMAEFPQRATEDKTFQAVFQ